MEGLLRHRVSRVLNLVALLFAGMLVAGIGVAVGMSNAGPSICMAATELQKFSPGYWPRVESRMSYRMIDAPSLVGPAWSPDELPGARPAKPARKPLFQTPPPRLLAQDPPSAFDDNLLGLPEDDELSEISGFWTDSPSPLGRVAELA